MQPSNRLELSVGAFVVLGALALGYLSINLGGVELGRARYPLSARFSSVGELRVGDPVKLAGVRVGVVDGIALVDYAARVRLGIERGLALPEDTIASIRTSGLLGDAYVSLSPGAAERDLPPGGDIQRTEPAISLTELIAKYAFGSHGTEPAASDVP